MTRIPCKWCSSPNHTQFYCKKKPRKPIPFESPKSKKKRMKTRALWYQQNPPDENGTWLCYLQISSLCPKSLTKETLTMEHVQPRVKAPELKYVVENIRPSCNKMKDSRTIEQLAKIWPHLTQYIDTLN